MEVYWPQLGATAADGLASIGWLWFFASRLLDLDIFDHRLCFDVQLSRWGQANLA